MSFDRWRQGITNFHTRARSLVGAAATIALACTASAICRAQTLSALYSFGNGAAVGLNPEAGLVEATDGSLYGTTAYGGAADLGIAFRLTTGGTLITFYSFAGGADGAYPTADLVQASDGNLYGTTVQGGANNAGTVFRITTGGSLTTLYSFSGSADGAAPHAGLVQASDGSLYGTTDYGGGASNPGTVFRITTGGTLTTIYSFSGADGRNPLAGLVQATDGNLYGTTVEGGSGAGYGYGTVFRITTGGTLSTLWSFSGGADGAYPIGGLVQASDGNLYGTTSKGGGANNAGTVFRITTGGTLSTLHSFTGGADGEWPFAGLMQATDGSLYGTTDAGGANNTGTVFRITTGGTLSTLHCFAGGADGQYPLAGLIQAADGNLYGTTYGGGVGSNGTVFRFAPQRPDVLLGNPSTGGLAFWYMAGAVPAGGAFISPSQNTAWKPAASADFTGSGTPDLLFQNQSTGQLAVWLMNGTTAVSGVHLSPTPPVGWNVVAVADFDGDGSLDILFQYASTGQLAIWYMNRTAVVSGAYVTQTRPAGWSCVGAGDFNGDGYPDILFQNASTGQLAVWFMNNNTVVSGAYITPVQQAVWKCVSVLDLDADGRPDLIFQNQSTGQIAYWLMNGTAAYAGGYMAIQPPGGWVVAGPH